jgi:hypothetical protein
MQLLPIALVGTTTLLISLTTFSSASLADKPANPSTTTAVPATLQPPSTQAVLYQASAQGVQVYSCQPQDKEPKKFAWKLKAPEATLYSSQGAKAKMAIGKHYAGPTWQHTDGSKIQGKVKTKVDSPIPTAIPWLLLDVTAHGGQGIFTKINYIQRLNTTGGKAPASGCDAANKNKEVRVNYTADYYFFGDAPTKKM